MKKLVLYLGSILLGIGLLMLLIWFGSVRLKGSVVDLAGQPLAGATVTGGLMPTASQADGTFTAWVPRWQTNTAELTVTAQNEQLTITAASLVDTISTEPLAVSYASPDYAALFGDEVMSDPALDDELLLGYNPDVDPSAVVLPILNQPEDLPPPVSESDFIVNAEGFEVVAGEVLVGWAEDTTAAQRTAVIEAAGATVRYDDPAARTSIAYSASNLAVTTVITQLEANSSVTGAMENYRLEPDVAPNDPDWKDQNKSWWLRELNAEPAWMMTTGQRTMVAVIDAGFQLDHPDLAGAFASTTMAFFAGAQPAVRPQHGTHVSGIIAARKDNNTGLSGIVPNARLVPIQLDNFGRLPTVFRMMAGWPNVRIANMSLGWGWAKVNRTRVASGLQPLTNAEMQAKADEYDQLIRPAFLDYYHKGGVVCKSAGNDYGLDARMNLLNFPEVIMVGSVDSDGTISSLSNIGSQVDIVAPGGEIWSTVAGSGYDYMSGTSMSTPAVCGTVAAIRSLRPNYGPMVIKRILERYGMPAKLKNQATYPQLDTWRALLGATKLYGVTGEVVGSNGLSLERALVTTQPSLWTVLTNADGEFILPYLKLQSYTVKAKSSDAEAEKITQAPALNADRVIELFFLLETEEEDEEENGNNNTNNTNTLDETDLNANDNANSTINDTGLGDAVTEETGGTTVLSNGLEVSAAGCALSGFDAPVITDEACPAGFKFSRETIACEQETCPASSIGRTYTLECKCADGQRGVYACDQLGYLVACIE